MIEDVRFVNSLMRKYFIKREMLLNFKVQC